MDSAGLSNGMAEGNILFADDLFRESVAVQDFSLGQPHLDFPGGPCPCGFQRLPWPGFIRIFFFQFRHRLSGKIQRPQDHDSMVLIPEQHNQILKILRVLRK